MVCTVALVDDPENQILSLPIRFIKAMSQARSLNDTLCTVSTWLNQVITAERVSITLARKDDPDHLHIFALHGNQAIPVDTLLPVAGTMIGKAYLTQRAVITGNSNLYQELDARMLHQAGLESFIGAPLISGEHCYGTLNIAHSKCHFYSRSHLLALQSIADWVASCIRLQLQAEDSLRLACTDFLTGALNRRAFMDRCQQRFLEARQQQKPDYSFAIGMLDVDFFKHINDTYGHDTGDKVLKHLASQLQVTRRRRDLLARFGGEEFIILFDAVQEDKLEKLADHCQDRLLEFNLKIGGTSVSYTNSMGLTLLNSRDQCIEDTIRRADHLLYEAKQRGRHQICWRPEVQTSVIA